MKVTEAIWEKRNLGVDCLEIDMDETDSLEQLDQVLENYKDKNYIVVKSPVKHERFLWGLPQRGFTYIESQIVFEAKKETYKAPSYMAVMERSTSLKRVSEQDDIIKALEKISDDVFDTDRITLDPSFSKEIAGQRFKNWIADLIRRGDYFLELYLKDNPVGFVIVNKDDGASLAGIYSNYKGKGLGMVLIKKGIDYVFSNGQKKIITGGVSSNNIDIIKIHLLLGFNINTIKYVYVKH